MTQEEAAIREELSRMQGLRFCGIWQTEYGNYALFEDLAGTQTSFMLHAGETLGDGIQRVTERYRAAPL